MQLVALGDSLTQGYGLNPAQGLVPQLQAWLDAHDADVTIVNAGVSGDTTAGGLSRLDWSLSNDTDAVMVALGGNDVLRGLPPAQSRANLTKILDQITARELPVLLAGIPVPENYGPEYRAEFLAIYPELAAQYDAVLVPNLLAPVMARPQDQAQLVQDDGIHPSADGVALIVEDLGPKVLQLLSRVDQP
ncbi:arylesterase [Thioclava sp. SK-1]|nr:arylesterase [Thioclava sp. SK-1]OCX66819.1 arylesterase [Thioclava sp. SK-1]